MTGKPFCRLYYHITWATRNMQKLMIPEIQEPLYRFFVTVCDQADYTTYGVNGMEDHIHTVLALSPDHALTETVTFLKNRCVEFCNKELDLEYPLEWHDSFGALTFARQDLPKIIDYVFHQKLRHQNNQLNPIMEKYWQD